MFWKGFTILNAIKNTCDLWEKVKISTLTGIQKTLIPVLIDDISGGSNCGCDGNSKRTRIRHGTLMCDSTAAIL